jgi:hypothetical protein
LTLQEQQISRFHTPSQYQFQHSDRIIVGKKISGKTAYWGLAFGSTIGENIVEYEGMAMYGLRKFKPPENYFPPLL